METKIFQSESQEIEKAIYNAFKSKNIWENIENNGDGEDSNTNWTSAINSILYTTAKSLHDNYLVASKQQANRDSPEWLFDVVWFSENDIGINNVHLIVESEWIAPERFRNEEYDYFHEIKYDFEKLIVGRADYRLMIFEGVNQVEIEKHIKLLNSIIRKSNITKNNDRYMYGVWNKESQEFIFDLYVHIT